MATTASLNIHHNLNRQPPPSKLASLQTVTDNGSSPMRYERNRLKTFEDWSCTFMRPHDLASSGFYSIKRDDVVRCAFCSVEIGQWEEGDDAMRDHQRWSNNCPFLRGRQVGNVPIGAAPEQTSPQVSAVEGQDTCGKYGIEVRPNSFPEREAGSCINNTSASNIASLTKLGITPNKGPTYPAYATPASRIRSFKDWPRSIKQKPEELASAGFFYTGKGDQTLCFHCGGGLKDWEDTDNPWEQHAKWFSKCIYLQIIKGHEYIAEICNRVEDTEMKASSASASKEIAVVEEEAIEPSSSAGSSSSTSSTPGKDVNLCKICYQDEMGVVFLPCGHLVACVKCAPSLTTCAVCRKPLEATVRAYLT